jgi:light-regulated signal transduction histidine kinase (bacteriophytochrome)
MNNEHSPETVDLSNCDREPIHIPASIQPHGLLLVLREPDLTISQTSANVAEYFGRSLDQVLAQPLSSLLSAVDFATLRNAVTHGQWEAINPLRLDIGGKLLDGILHRHAGALILELESTSAAARHESMHHPLRPALVSLQYARTLEALCDTVVREVRHLTGFERVMLYRFHANGDGSVDSESKEPFLEPYLHLHYPAADIPRQPRELYLKNWLRIIPDSRYVPVPIVPTLRPDTGAPLDLSFSVLRSVSPIHLEYMANMGVRASMSISLIVRDRLWGLISCANHTAARPVAFELRSACEILGRLASLQIAAVEEHEAELARLSRRETRAELARVLRDGDGLEGALERPNELMKIVAAEGAAVLSGSDTQTCGSAPSFTEIKALAGWLDGRVGIDLFSTSSLSSLYPGGGGIAEVASGILTFALPGAPRRRLIWFRPEVLKNVNWGGDPRKPVETDRSMGVHPRRSFELWKQEVRLHSAVWTGPDMEAAENFRRDAVEIDLERQVVRGQRAVQARDDLVAVVSHDLRNPLGVIQMQAAVLLQTVGRGNEDFSRRIQTSTDHIQRAVRRMNTLIRDLLDLAKLEAGRFTLQCSACQINELIEESLLILRPLAEAKRITLSSDLHGDTVSADRDRIFQVLSNLVGNAIKFTPEQGSIRVRAEALNTGVLVTVSDTGPGIPADQLDNIFDRYWQARRSDQEGSGLGLFIAKGIVEAHGGRIWAEDHLGGGATFTFQLPRVP